MKHLFLSKWILGILFLIASSFFLFRFNSTQPKIVVIVDDLGSDLDVENKMRDLGNLVTWSIIPQRKYTAYYSKLASEFNAEVMMHLPMAYLKQKKPIDKNYYVSDEMTDDEIKSLLDRDLASVPNIVGVNNHKGSAATADLRVMRVVLKYLSDRKLFFLNSKTSSSNTVKIIAKDLGITTLSRDVFIDHDPDNQSVEQQMDLLANIARKNKLAIGIAHVRENSAEIIKRKLIEFKEKGFLICTVSQIL
jgi:polysaccharide deacetylase 2 family uncharacterized protein YibQ